MYKKLVVLSSYPHIGQQDFTVGRIVA